MHAWLLSVVRILHDNLSRSSATRTSLTPIKRPSVPIRMLVLSIQLPSRRLASSHSTVTRNRHEIPYSCLVGGLGRLVSVCNLQSLIAYKDGLGQEACFLTGPTQVLRSSLLVLTSKVLSPILNPNIRAKSVRIRRAHNSSTLSKPIPTSHSSFLIAATFQSVDTNPSSKEFKSALASDSSWHEAFEWESRDIQKWHKNWSKVDDFILFCDRIYVPPSLHPKILFEHHDTPLAGHPGHVKTIELITQDFSWPGLAQDVRRYVRNLFT